VDLIRDQEQVMAREEPMLSGSNNKVSMFNAFISIHIHR
jgi:hypothetical protein